MVAASADESPPCPPPWPIDCAWIACDPAPEVATVAPPNVLFAPEPRLIVTAPASPPMPPVPPLL